VRTLIDRGWPAAPLLVLALAAVVVVVGIAAAPAPTDRQRVGEALHDVARAVQERRGEDACALLTPHAQQAVAARTGTLDCADTVRTFGLGVDAAALEAAQVTGVSVAGTRATVARGQLLQPDGTPFGKGAVLERAGDGWRLVALT
jgi:phage tail tape-measure protein